MAVHIDALNSRSSKLPALSCLSNLHTAWIPIVATTVTFPLEAFWLVCDETVRYPERNSTSILRCDLMEDASCNEISFTDYVSVKRIRRNILPRRKFDKPLLQDCHFFESRGVKHTTDALLVLLPLLADFAAESVPYYHPKVAGIAFRYFRNMEGVALVQLEFLPLQAPAVLTVESDQPYYSSDSRTYRTALALLTTFIKHGKGHYGTHVYKKRVNHDTLIQREHFQDLYQRLKEKYTWIVKEWKESTDPMKHVFEDIAIATFLICLWQSSSPDKVGRPLGGFVDVGCGNGLLVYILVQEGYEGFGFDMRARKSWSLWQLGSRLRITSLSPPDLCLSTHSPFPAGAFLIGNHVDELTPWLPLLAARTPGSSFLNIPCCLHTFTGRFNSGSYPFPPGLQHLPGIKEDMNRIDGLSSEKGGRYNAYLNYIAEVTVRSGWRPEREALRIPSTKNWGFVGRKRIWKAGMAEDEAVGSWIRQIATDAKDEWQPRKEGPTH